MCEVINIHHTLRMYDIYIGYPQSGPPYKWGNQFDVAGDLFIEERDKPFFDKLPPRDDLLAIDYAVLMYREWLLHTPEGLRLQEDIDELRGKVLGCFCKPRPCHGDVLVELLGQREEIDDGP